MPDISVSDWVHSELSEIKEEKDHTSFDSAIRELIHEYRD